MTATTIHLRPDFFGEAEKILVEHGGMRVSTFAFPSGVAGVRIANSEGEIVMLPYQGQQVWSARFRGRELGMISMFDEPQPTTEFLKTYGGFIIHCGATAMGPPGPQDDHPAHGELPNARYQSAWLSLDGDAAGAAVTLAGRFRYTVAFKTNYVATPAVRLRQGASRLEVSLSVENLKKSPMELMYLSHINFRPVNGGRLHASHKPGPEHVRVRRNLPSHVVAPPGYREFIEALAVEPQKHQLLTPDLRFDPEVVFFIDYLVDADGWATSLQLHPDGSADVVRHKPSELAHGPRWISRTADQDCLAIVMPATAEPEGLTAERAKGFVGLLGPKATFRCAYEVGVLAPDEAKAAAAAIDALVG